MIQLSLNPSFSGCPALGVSDRNGQIMGILRLNPSFSGCPALGK